MTSREQPLLARRQSCGCIVCFCSDPERCHGCGARHCGKHRVGEFADPIYQGREQPTNETKCICDDRITCAYHEEFPEIPKSVPTPVPREWLTENGFTPVDRLISQHMKSGTVNLDGMSMPLYRILESYSSHVNAALMERLAQLRIRAFRNSPNKSCDHATDCTIWRDDGNGNAPEFDNSCGPCNCGALERFQQKRADAAESRISELERERDELLAMKLGGKFPQTRDEILTQSFCGVSGHFRFQQNGSSCLMCQRESRLVSKAKNEAESPTISSTAGVPIRPQEDCMSEPKEVEFNELVGKHFLSGVDRENVEVKTWGEHFEPCEVLRFVLDGKTYTATEDPSDGYRSSMRSFVESESPVINQFVPVEVMAVYQDKGDYGTSSDILNLIDAVTGKVVLSVGTDNNDDYYPSFIGYFAPENMACNSSAEPPTTPLISERDSKDE